AVALHFIDDLDSKLNQLRTAREANPGILFHRGLGRFVYLPPVEPQEPIEVVVDGEGAQPAHAADTNGPEDGRPQPRLFEIR
ncbi:MAG TPA: hypothetical protein VMM92_05195, partial [Thermoanaerobaculia bacterium]|nr:hypothetical protein [Thermoanaerobaculia bacterium]